MKKNNIILIIILLIIDIITKQIIINLLSVGESIKIINNLFYITLAKNYGAAFSILQNERLLFLIVTILIIFLLINYINKKDTSKLEGLSYSLIISGALGNFIDRLIRGYVIDFIDIRILSYHYPTFNLADSFIVIGVIILIIDGIRKEKNENKSKQS